MDRQTDEIAVATTALAMQRTVKTKQNKVYNICMAPYILRQNV